ncbi:hypothetical protein [Streptomyces europaeiscabiei]|nr:hypothetical protein OG858_07060 [Streptomyces europaeiscabiei]
MTEPDQRRVRAAKGEPLSASAVSDCHREEAVLRQATRSVAWAVSR